MVFGLFRKQVGSKKPSGFKSLTHRQPIRIYYARVSKERSELRGHHANLLFSDDQETCMLGTVMLVILYTVVMTVVWSLHVLHGLGWVK